MKQSCKQCAWKNACTDPCSDECPNMQVLDSIGELIEGKDYCEFDQGSSKCQKVIGAVCKQFELPSEDIKKKVKKYQNSFN